MRTSVCQALALSVGLLATLPAVESVVIGIDFGADWFKVRPGAPMFFFGALMVVAGAAGSSRRVSGGSGEAWQSPHPSRLE